MAEDSDFYDSLDIKIVQALELDGRAPFSRIAEVLGVSDQTVARRFRRLRATAGLRVVGVRDPAVLGQDQWMLRLRCTPDSAEAIATALARRPDTAWIGLVSGGTEVSCTTRPRSRDERDELLLGRLPRTPSIHEVRAYQLLHLFTGGPAGRLTSTPDLTEDQVRALLPCRQPSGEPAVLAPEDTSLVAALERDGRATLPELHRATGRSESAIKRRLDVLLNSGVLYIDVEFDCMALGITHVTQLWITTEPSVLDSVGNVLARHPEVVFAAATSGISNLVAVALFRDAAGLYSYLHQRLGALEGVRQVEAAPIMQRVKQLTFPAPPRGLALRRRGLEGVGAGAAG